MSPSISWLLPSLSPTCPIACQKFTRLFHSVSNSTCSKTKHFPPSTKYDFDDCLTCVKSITAFQAPSGGKRCLGAYQMAKSMDSSGPYASPPLPATYTHAKFRFYLILPSSQNANLPQISFYNIYKSSNFCDYITLLLKIFSLPRT